MARLIEVQNPQSVSSGMVLKVGDVLLFRATGGHVQSGAEVVQMVGAFVPAILGDNASILTPMGAPNTVLFRALQPGQAMIDVITGDPWRASQRTELAIVVES
jgi:hypothetical protein